MSKPFARERRRTPDHTAGDSFMKKLVVSTICAIAVLIVATLCYCTVTAVAIPDQLDRLANLILGGILTMLVKTGVESAKSDTPQPVIVENTPKNAVPTENVQPEGEKNEA